MAGKLTRKQHIVTRGLLAKFVDHNGVLWVYEKNKPVRKAGPKMSAMSVIFTR